MDSDDCSEGKKNGENVVAFRASKVASALTDEESASLDEGIRKLDQHLADIAAGRIQALDGPDGIFQLAWRGKKKGLVKKWQKTLGPGDLMSDMDD